MTFTVRVDLTQLPWEPGGERLVKDVLEMLDEAATQGWVLQFYARTELAMVLPELLRTCADQGHDVDLFPSARENWEVASEYWRRLGLTLHGAAHMVEGADFVAFDDNTINVGLPLSEPDRTEIKLRLREAKMRTHRRRWKDARL